MQGFEKFFKEYRRTFDEENLKDLEINLNPYAWFQLNCLISSKEDTCIYTLTSFIFSGV